MCVAPQLFLKRRPLRDARLPNEGETDLKREARRLPQERFQHSPAPSVALPCSCPTGFLAKGSACPFSPLLSDSRSVIFPAVPSCGCPRPFLPPSSSEGFMHLIVHHGLCLVWPWLVFVLDSEVSAGDCSLLFVSVSWCQHRTIQREVLVTVPWFS